MSTMLTLPNLLTLSRIVTVPLLALFLWWPEWELGYAIAFVIYCLMGVTDYFDGYLARARGTVSKLGVFLDPIADKIMVAAVILVLTSQGVLHGPYVGEAHVVAGLIILVREIAVSGLREFLGP
jgi:cardiolipin synthase